MKKILFSVFCVWSLAAAAQSDADIKPAEKGVVYGAAVPASGTPVSVNELTQKVSGGAFEGKVTGTVKEVCKSMGCWIKLEKADGTTVTVKSKDHGYFMPQNLVGKTVVVAGTALVKEVSEAQRKHLAEDGGKSKAEIATIKGATKEVQVVATGVEVMD